MERHFWNTYNNCLPKEKATVHALSAELGFLLFLCFAAFSVLFLLPFSPLMEGLEATSATEKQVRLCFSEVRTSVR